MITINEGQEIKLKQRAKFATKLGVLLSTRTSGKNKVYMSHLRKDPYPNSASSDIRRLKDKKLTGLSYGFTRIGAEGFVYCGLYTYEMEKLRRFIQKNTSGTLVHYTTDIEMLVDKTVEMLKILNTHDFIDKSSKGGRGSRL